MVYYDKHKYIEAGYFWGKESFTLFIYSAYVLSYVSHCYMIIKQMMHSGPQSACSVSISN